MKTYSFYLLELGIFCMFFGMLSRDMLGIVQWIWRSIASEN